MHDITIYTLSRISSFVLSFLSASNRMQSDAGHRMHTGITREDPGSALPSPHRPPLVLLYYHRPTWNRLRALFDRAGATQPGLLPL